MRRQALGSSLALSLAVSLLAGTDVSHAGDEEAAHQRINQAFDVALGIDAVSNYVDGAESLSGGRPSVSAFIEPAYGIVYAGIGFATLRSAEQIETRFCAGLRPDFGGPVAFDIGVQHTIIDGVAGDSETSAHVEAEFEPVERLEVGLEAEYAFQEKEWELAAAFGFKIVESVTLFAALGHEFGDQATFWRAGGSYAFNDSLSASVTYAGSDEGLSTVFAGLSLRTSVARLSGSAIADDD